MFTNSKGLKPRVLSQSWDEKPTSQIHFDSNFTHGKVMTTIFWDSHGVIFKKEKPLQGHTTVSLLPKLMVKISAKRSHLQKKKIMSSTTAVVMAKLHKLWFELLDQPPYPPNLASSGFFLLPHLKTAVEGERFSSNTFANNYFTEKNAEYYLNGLERWEHRWEKCVQLKGDFTEK